MQQTAAGEWLKGRDARISDTVAAATLFQFNTMLGSGISLTNPLSMTKSSALLGIHFEVFTATQGKKSIDVSVIPGIRHILRKPVQVVIYEEGDLVFAECKELDIVEGGMTEIEALEEFFRFFTIEADSLLNSTDDSLCADALILRDRYREHLGG